MACGGVSTTGAEGLVEQKWGTVENIATNAVAAADAAMSAIAGEAGGGIRAAGLGWVQLTDSGAGSIDVTYNDPEQPELPDLEYDNPGITATYGRPDPYTSLSLGTTQPPSFGGGAPQTRGLTPFQIEALGDFSTTYRQPTTPTYQSPDAPSAFNGSFTPDTVTVAPITKPGVFSGIAPVATVKNTPTAPHSTLTNPPTITMPDYPSPVDPQFPTQSTEINIPLPTLRIPDLSGIDELLDQLLAGQPTAPVFAIPDDNFLDTFNSLRTTLGPELNPVLPIEEVLTWMLSGTSVGIPANVALMLRDRAFQAEDKLAFQAESEALHDWLSRGFTLPGGALAAQLSAVRQQNRDKKAELNRNLWIEEAKLEIEALREAVKMGIQYQSALWDSKTKLWSVCGDLANRFMDVQIKVLEITLSAYKAQLDAWQAEANVIKDYLAAKLQAELSKLEITKVEAQISGLFVQINGQRVDLYKAQMDGVMAEINVYKAQIDAANGKMQAESLKIEAYAKQVQAYGTAVQAYEAEWRGYSAAVQADTAQVEAFKATIQAYGVQADVYGKEVEAERNRVMAEVEVGKLGLDTYKTQASVYSATVDAYSKQVDAEKSRVLAEVEIAKLPLEVYKAEAQAYSAQADAYGKRVQAHSAQAQAEVEIAKLPIEIYKAQAQAYAAEVDGYGKTVDADRVRATTHVELEKLKLDGFRHELEVYKAELTKTSIELESKARIHGSQVQLFGALVDSEKSRVGAELQVIDQRLRQAQYESGVELKKAELEQTKVLGMAELALKAESEVGRIASQLAASALSAVNATATIGNSYSASRSVGCSETYTYEMTS